MLLPYEGLIISVQHLIQPFCLHNYMRFNFTDLEIPYYWNHVQKTGKMGFSTQNNWRMFRPSRLKTGRISEMSHTNDIQTAKAPLRHILKSQLAPLKSY